MIGFENLPKAYSLVWNFLIAKICVIICLLVSCFGEKIFMYQAF